MTSSDFVVRLVAQLPPGDFPSSAYGLLRELTSDDPDAEMAEGTDLIAVFWTRVTAPSIEEAVVGGAQRVRTAAQRAFEAPAGGSWPPGVTNVGIEAYPLIDAELEGMTG